MAGRCTVFSATLRGVEALLVEVEVVVGRGMPAFNIVGMADAAVQESRERVKVALKESGYEMPGDRVLVNLAPSYLRKTGSGFDLAIAAGLLAATGQVSPEAIRGSLFVGELSLDGAVRGVKGLLAYAMCARDHGLQLVCSSTPDGLVPIEDARVMGLECLRDLRSGSYRVIECSEFPSDPSAIDFSDISGNEMGKRALQVAAAGNHGILMTGPPGSGKTMLASRLPTIMPELDEEAKLQCALVYSVAGEAVGSVLSGSRPFRAPHHSATSAGLIGGGNPVRPGEVSLAHAGVLFLDEIPEFRPSVLQQLRQPLEDGIVRICRADGTVEFPAEFMLVAAANPCPCGYFGDEVHECTCTPQKINDYQNRLGGPLMDRIDIHIDVKRVPPGDVIEGRLGSSSEDLKAGVMAGREYSSWRKAHCSPSGEPVSVVAECNLKESEELFLEKAAARNGMSGRGIVRTLSVARTIADIAQRKSVSKADLCEALALRLRSGASV